jgi:large subunit ribosomal protein L13
MIGKRSYLARKETVQHKWYVVDAADKPIGRLAVIVARILSGKNKPIFTPHVDTGDFVIVVNADKVVLTGKKAERERIYWHTGYPGGIKSMTFGEMLAKKPERLFERVVKGMLPKTRLDYIRKLKVYAGPSHPHAAQMPEKLED